MTWRILPAVLALLTCSQARADLPGAMFPPLPNQLCRQAIAAAERAHGIPANLLAAIARVESGRRDEVTGTFNPWPWTINMDGQGSFYDNKAQAFAAATAMRPRATRSIDVGCMQISLVFHPDAFASLMQAFDPPSNADYGARYLGAAFRENRILAKGGGALSLRHAGAGTGISAQGLRGLAGGTEVGRRGCSSRDAAVPGCDVRVAGYSVRSAATDRTDHSAITRTRRDAGAGADA